ncbi:hypothetical protein SRHO_G00219380 [Serrasalmus rhombeus]
MLWPNSVDKGRGPHLNAVTDLRLNPSFHFPARVHRFQKDKPAAAAEEKTESKKTSCYWGSATAYSGTPSEEMLIVVLLQNARHQEVDRF